MQVEVANYYRQVYNDCIVKFVGKNRNPEEILEVRDILLVKDRVHRMANEILVSDDKVEDVDHYKAVCTRVPKLTENLPNS